MHPDSWWGCPFWRPLNSTLQAVYNLCGLSMCLRLSKRICYCLSCTAVKKLGSAERAAIHFTAAFMDHGLLYNVAAVPGTYHAAVHTWYTTAWCTRNFAINVRIPQDAFQALDTWPGFDSPLQPQGLSPSPLPAFGRCPRDFGHLTNLGGGAAPSKISSERGQPPDF